MTDLPGEANQPSRDEVATAATPLAGWKVLVALITLGVVVGGFLAVFGHTLRLFG